jgi:pyruvate formate lyase activating enzyme
MRAAYQQALPDGSVRCQLCPHRCTLREGSAGLCGVRRVEGGHLITTVYGRVDALHLDPIEKKPLFHVRPGSTALSLATVGCNLRCSFCQNHELSQAGEPAAGASREGRPMSPSEVVQRALEAGAGAIAYTYSEPTVFYEYARAISDEAAAAGLLNVAVTNGYIARAPLEAWLPTLHAANVDVKFADDAGYRRHTGGTLGPVLATLEALWGAGRWAEATTLLIPGLNDSDADLSAIAGRLVAISPDLPWHVSRFHPTYRLTDRPATPAATLVRALDLGRAAGLRYVYPGNLFGRGGEDTHCPSCDSVVIGRSGYSVTTRALEGGCCAACGATIAGVF